MGTGASVHVLNHALLTMGVSHCRGSTAPGKRGGRDLSLSDPRERADWCIFMAFTTMSRSTKGTARGSRSRVAAAGSAA